MTDPVNVLVVGSGGREHALVMALKSSPLCQQIYCAPGNDGIALDCPCLPANSIDDIRSVITGKSIGLVVIGPEQHLADGWVDALQPLVKIIGPSNAAARLESSKSFMKEIANAANVPTAQFATFTDSEAAIRYIKTRSFPLVIKADGLAAGKGVVIARTREQAHQTIVEFLDEQKYGKASGQIVIEEHLQGPEISVFYLVADGKARLIGAAQDHKRLLDNDQGPNTGGMGSFSPCPLFTEQLAEQIHDQFVIPTLAEMIRRGTPYQGFLFAGLMLTETGPKLLEYNVRLGDPETQSLLPLIQSDLLLALLDPGHEITLDNRTAVTLVLAAPGYPEAPQKNLVIASEEKMQTVRELVSVTVAGAHRQNNEWLSGGGRVLGLTATRPTLSQARDCVYEAARELDWQTAHYRNDIAKGTLIYDDID